MTNEEKPKLIDKFYAVILLVTLIVFAIVAVGIIITAFKTL